MMNLKWERWRLFNFWLGYQLVATSSGVGTTLDQDLIRTDLTLFQLIASLRFSDATADFHI